MRKVKINRAKWRTGANSKFKTGEGDTELCNDLGYMCCLGFAGCQLSKKNRKLFINQLTPSDTLMVISPLTTKNDCGSILDTDFSNKAMNINDDDSITVKTKEKRLTALFAKNNIKLEFYGSYDE